MEAAMFQKVIKSYDYAGGQLDQIEAELSDIAWFVSLRIRHLQKTKEEGHNLFINIAESGSEFLKKLLQKARIPGEEQTWFAKTNEIGRRMTSKPIFSFEKYIEEAVQFDFLRENDIRVLKYRRSRCIEAGLICHSLQSAGHLRL